VREENISDWRRRTFGDLTAAFRFGGKKAKPPVLPDADAELTRAYHAATHFPKPAAPATGQAAPIQEKGSRKKIS